MSTKTSLKKVAVIAAMALTLGGFTAVSANAAVVTAASSEASQTIASGQSITTTITMDPTANTGDTTAVTFAATGGATAIWSLTNLGSGNTKVTVGSTSGTQAAGFTLATKNANDPFTANLTVTVTGTTGSTITIGGLTPAVVLTVGSTVITNEDIPFQVNTADNTAGSVSGDVDTSGDDLAITKKVESSTAVTKIRAESDTAALTGNGNYRYVEVTGSTINDFTGSWVLNGLKNSATQAAAPQSGSIDTSQIWVNSAASGATITVKFLEKLTDDVTGFVTIKTLQTITIKTETYSGINAALSTARICSTGTTGTYPTGGCSLANPTTSTDKDDVVQAKSALTGVGGLSPAADAKAVIRVDLNSITSTGAATPLVGTKPAIGASVEGPGMVSISYTAGGADASGRLVTVASPTSNVFYINVFSDGTSGVGKINIWVGGSIWKSKTVSFYGDVTKLVATQNHKVLKAGVPTGDTCDDALTPAVEGVNLDNCSGDTIAQTYAIQVVALDANGVAVPGVTPTAVPDAAVITASSAEFSAPSVGATWFSVLTASDAASGKTGTVSYKYKVSATSTIVSETLTFAIGGAVSTVSAAASGATEIGAKNALTITAKDAAGNAPYDQDLSSSMASNVALVSGSSAATSGLPSSFKLLNGSATANFFNPVVAGDVTISGKIAGVAASVTVSVSNSALNAAADAAAEATDAANAATDAANAAAEAADAATAAAQDAADAVAALSAQVTAMISALKKQLIALTNLVIKIQKKVRA